MHRSLVEHQEVKSVKLFFLIESFKIDKQIFFMLLKKSFVFFSLGVFTFPVYSFSPFKASHQEPKVSSQSIENSLFKDIKFKVQKYQLSNGMTILLHVDRKIPMIAIQKWYRVGSFDEDPGRTGLAHFFEHLMFRGTQNYPDGEFNRLISQIGGDSNASTSRDYTNYYEIVPKKSLELILKLEADRMTNLILNEAIIQREREVVKEERRMSIENSPWRFAFEKMMAKTFGDHQYAHSVIGSMKDLNQTQIKDFKAFYKKYYAPNNSVLVIVGDFKPSRVKSWIKKYFGPIPRAPIKRQTSKVLPLQTQKTYLRIAHRFENRKLVIYFQAPPLGTSESLALDIVCEALAGDEVSPLYVDLVEKRKIATGLNLWNYSMKHSGVLSFFVNISGKKSFQIPEIVFYNKVTRIQKEGLSQKTLQKIKDKIMLNHIELLTTIDGKADILARSEVLQGDYTSFFKDLKSYKSITNQDIMNVANKYIKIGKANVLALGK